MGLHAALDTYNTCVLTFLLFVAQLEYPPPAVLQLEKLAVRRIAPGPGAWCSPADLQHGLELGLSRQIRPLRETCMAAMLRMHAWESRADGGIPWRRLQQELVDARGNTDHVVHAARLHKWYAQHIPTVVLTVVHDASRAGIDVGLARRQIIGRPAGALTASERRKFQRRTQ